MNSSQSYAPLVKTIEWTGGVVRIIDQTRLPEEVVFLTFDEYRPLIDAIKDMRIRGAPAIGIAAAFGVALAMRASTAGRSEDFRGEFEKVSQEFLLTRPTGVNLSSALRRLDDCLSRNIEKLPLELKDLLLREALQIYEDDRAVCRRIGRNGAHLIEDGWTVLTHCNAGALATADYGTALGCLYAAVEEGKRITVYVDETRPLLQGARLTSWELQQAGIDAVLICDSMAAWVMREGKVNCVMVGADRIAANGDVANKIGTYGLAVSAKEHGIPFYVAAPMSTFDLSLEKGDDIPIEERSSSEVTEPFGHRTAPDGVNVYNPAFDVTPAHLVTAIICESGIATSPYERSLSHVMDTAEGRAS